MSPKFHMTPPHDHHPCFPPSQPTWQKSKSNMTGPSLASPPLLAMINCFAVTPLLWALGPHHPSQPHHHLPAHSPSARAPCTSLHSCSLAWKGLHRCRAPWPSFAWISHCNLISCKMLSQHCVAFCSTPLHQIPCMYLVFVWPCTCHCSDSLFGALFES